MNLISFSLYGKSEVYSCGAVENARLARALFPEWQTIFFLDELVSPSVKIELESLGALTVGMGKSTASSGMFWRFHAVELPGVERVIFRDTDSRISSRECLLIQEWTQSEKELHIIRDHPFHAIPILGGMWGVQGSRAIEEVRFALESNSSLNPESYGSDQVFLARAIYPLFSGRMMVHDAIFNFERGVVRPPKRASGEFVGERINCLGEPELENRLTLMKVEASFARLLVTRLVANLRNYLGRKNSLFRS
jgi:hypothetical protein